MLTGGRCPIGWSPEGISWIPASRPLIGWGSEASVLISWAFRSCVLIGWDAWDRFLTGWGSRHCILIDWVPQPFGLIIQVAWLCLLIGCTL